VPCSDARAGDARRPIYCSRRRQSSKASMDPEKSSTKKGVEDANLNTIDELRHRRINTYGVSIEACATTNKTNASSYPTAEYCN